jgi:glycosyltransferase involved in cell wall biosynthesis
MNTPVSAPPPLVAIVVSHPIQHFVPYYRALASCGSLRIQVIYASRIGLERYFDREMNAAIEWHMDLLSGYQHTFLPEAASITEVGPRTVSNPSIGRELEALAPDAVLIYGYIYRTARLALAWCNRRGVPAIMIADSERRSPRSRATRIAKSLIVPRILRRFRAFATVGDCNEEYYAHYGVARARMFRTPFTIDEQSYRDARANRQAIRARQRAEWHLGADEILVLTVGKVSQRKRAADVIEAAAICRTANPASKLRFVIAGDGIELAVLRERVRRDQLPVMFLGFVNVDQLTRVYAACDLIAHPASADPHPLVMSEAACIGMPLIVSDRVGAVGPTDIAREGANAIVFPMGDTAALARIVCELAIDPERIALMSARSSEIFDELDVNRSVCGLVDAVDYCLQSAR